MSDRNTFLLCAFAVCVSIGSGCASKRLIAVENRQMKVELTDLQERLVYAEGKAIDTDSFATSPTLEHVHLFLDQAGIRHTYSEGASTVDLTYTGQNTNFSVSIRQYNEHGVLLLSTRDLFYLSETTSTESMVLLLVQMATINYELLLGKLQLNPSTGEVLLSMEIQVSDGLGIHTLVETLHALCSNADEQYLRLVHAASGLGT